MTEVEFLTEYNVNLDEQQSALLQLQHHPVLVNGKTGSGKTFLLLNRIAYLLKSEVAKKEEMLNLVYDKQVAKEMTKQYRYLFGDDGTIPHFIDIYTFAYHIIRRDLEAKEQAPWKAYKDLGSVIRRLCSEMFSLTITKDQCIDLLAKISECKNLRTPEKQMVEMVIPGCEKVNFLALYKEFVKYKEKKQIYDYDDVLEGAIEVLMKNHELLEVYQKRCRFIHVDDAQEISFLGHMLLKILGSQSEECMMFADQDLSLARLRAAYPQALHSFADTFANGVVITLVNNYRNNATIVHACNRFFYKGKDGLHTTSEETCDLKFKGFGDISKLYAYAVKKVVEDESEIGFLYRDFAMAVPLIESFKEKGISFCFNGNMKHFLLDPYVVDMWNFIELLIDPRDMRAFLEIYDKMGLDISKRVLIEVGDRLRSNENVDVYQALMESSYKQAGKKKLAGLMERIRIAENKSTLDMVLFIREKMGYNDFLRKQRRPLNSPIILAFECLAERYTNPDEFIFKVGQLKDFEGDTTSRVQIRSLADVRGCEFDRVCMIDCIGGILPAKDDEEERRLFYNGMTRAKHELEFFSTKRCTNHRLEISPFLYELHDIMNKSEEVEESTPTSVVKKLRPSSLRRGKFIRHKNLGVGKIMKITDGMMHVQFDDGVKQMNVKTCIQRKLIELVEN